MVAVVLLVVLASSVVPSSVVLSSVVCLHLHLALVVVCLHLHLRATRMVRSIRCWRRIPMIHWIPRSTTSILHWMPWLQRLLHKTKNYLGTNMQHKYITFNIDSIQGP